MSDALLISIYTNHCTNAFEYLIDRQRVMLPWLTVYDNNQYSCRLSYFGQCLQIFQRYRESFLEETNAHSSTVNSYFEMFLDMITEITMNKEAVGYLF